MSTKQATNGADMKPMISAISYIPFTLVVKILVVENKKYTYTFFAYDGFRINIGLRMGVRIRRIPKIHMMAGPVGAF